MTNPIKPKRTYKNYIIPMVLSILILSVLGVYAGNLYLSDDASNYLQGSNNGNYTTMNESGIYINNNKAYSRADDVVVCRGTSLIDDLIKSFQCDVVVLSTDTPTITSQKINNSIGNGGKTIYIKGEGLDYPYILLNTTAGRINLCGKNNTRIYGDGIDETVLFNNGFYGNCSTTSTSNLFISDLTVDLNGSVNMGLNQVYTYGTPPYDNGAYSYNLILERVKFQNASSTFLIQMHSQGGHISDSIFIDGGLNVAADNVVISNFGNNLFLFRDNLIIKKSSAGGGGFTNGGSQNLELTGNEIIDYSGNSYAAISMEGQGLGFSDIYVNNNKINYSSGKGYISVGVSTTTRNYSDVYIKNNVIKGGGIIVQLKNNTYIGKNSHIIDNEIYRGQYGLILNYCENKCSVIGNKIYDYNYFNSSYLSDKGLVLTYNNNTVVNDNILSSFNSSYYGIRLISSSNISIKNNKLYGLSESTRYTFSSSTNYFIDNYIYPVSIDTLDATSDIFNKETVYNNTNKCFSNGTDWLCSPISLDTSSFFISGNNLTTNNINKTGIMYPNNKGISSEGLVAYYTGSNLYDYSGNGFNGNSNNILYFNGKFGNAFLFNTTNFINTSYNVSSIIGNTSLSVFAWINSSDDADKSIIAKDINTARNWFFTYYGLDIHIRMYNSTSAIACELQTATNSVKEGLWNHVGFTWDNTNMNLTVYNNGVIIGTLNCPSLDGFVSNNNPLLIGTFYNKGTAYSFNGSIDEVMIFNRTLSLEEIKSLYEKNIEFTPNNANQLKGQDVNPITNIFYNLGSSVLRWLKLWVVNIDVSGTANLTNVTIPSGNTLCLDGESCIHYLKYNGTCITNGTACIG